MDGASNLYLFTDGYADQFGGIKGDKFGYRNFRKLITEMSIQSMSDQKEILLQTFEDWKSKGKYEQLDDVCVIGIRL